MADREPGSPGRVHVSAHNPHAGQGPVVLDIGGTAGALVLRAGRELAGREIDVSPVDDDAARQHVEVLARSTPAGPRFAAVYGSLPAGRWTVWDADGRPALVVEVTGGAVTEVDWPPGRP